MLIGELSRRAGVSVQTVRYYERRGLLAEPSRTLGGYRQYTDDALDRMRFIRRAQDLGFTLSEIADLLVLRLDPRTPADASSAERTQRSPTSTGAFAASSGRGRSWSAWLAAVVRVGRSRRVRC